MFVSRSYSTQTTHTITDSCLQYAGYQLGVKFNYAFEPVDQLVKQTREISQAVLNKKEPITNHSKNVHYQPMVFEQASPRFNLSYINYIFFNSRSSCCKRSHSSRHKHRKADSNNNNKPDPVDRAILIAAGSLLIGAGGYLVQKASQQVEAIRRERAALECYCNGWIQYKEGQQAHYDNPDYHTKLYQVTERARAILKREQSEKNYSIALRVSMITAGMFLLLGGAIGSSELIAAGAVIGAGMMVFDLARSLYKGLTQYSQKDAEFIRSTLNTMPPLVSPPAYPYIPLSQTPPPPPYPYSKLPAEAPNLYPIIPPPQSSVPFVSPPPYPYACEPHLYPIISAVPPPVTFVSTQPSAPPATDEEVIQYYAYLNSI